MKRSGHSCENHVNNEELDYAAGLLSDAGLAFIATRLGFEWTLLAILLGVPQEKLEQVQMSMQANVYQQILEVLRFWRDLPIHSGNPVDLQKDGGGDAGRAGNGKVRGKIFQLLRALRQDGIEKFELVDQIMEKFHIEMDE